MMMIIIIHIIVIKRTIEKLPLITSAQSLLHNNIMLWGHKAVACHYCHRVSQQQLLQIAEKKMLMMDFTALYRYWLPEYIIKPPRIDVHYYKNNNGGISRVLDRRRAGDMYIVFSRLRPAVSKLYHKHISFGNGLLHCSALPKTLFEYFTRDFFSRAGRILAQYKLFLLTLVMQSDFSHYTSFMWNSFHTKSDLSYWPNGILYKYIIVYIIFI